MTRTYTVKVNDTLSKIGALYNVSWQDIMKWNNLTSTVISPGQVLNVSDPTVDDPSYPVVGYLRRQ